jgi:hypothetical protein
MKEAFIAGYLLLAPFLVENRPPHVRVTTPGFQALVTQHTQKPARRRRPSTSS